MISSSSVARRFGQVGWALLVVVTAVAFGEVLAGDGCATTRVIATDCRQQLTKALETKVSDALDLPAFEAELEQLVAASSLCAVDTLLEPYAPPADAGAAAAALSDTTKALRAQRARVWLQKHPMPR